MNAVKLLSAGSLLAVGAAGALGVSALVDRAPVAETSPNTPSAATTAAYVPVSFTAASSAAKSYEIDGVHSGVVFRIMHAGAAPFYGMFPGISGSMVVDPANPAATSIDVSIDTSKISTGNNNRDDHLRSADFFNARQFPNSTFKATGATPGENGTMTAEGQLTLLGKTLPVTATITPTGEGTFRNSTRAGFEATLSFNRSDFGMTMYVQEGTLGDEVQLTVFIEGIEQ